MNYLKIGNRIKCYNYGKKWASSYYYEGIIVALNVRTPLCSCKYHMKITFLSKVVNGKKRKPHDDFFFTPMKNDNDNDIYIEIVE